MELWTLFFAFVVFQIPASSFRIQGGRTRGGASTASDARDAIESCGEADEQTLKRLDRPCNENGTDTGLGEVEGLYSIFTSRGQPKTDDQYKPFKYRLPPYRLYICHPNAVQHSDHGVDVSIKAVLYSAHGKQIITSAEEMETTLQLLFANNLWNLKRSLSEYMYRRYKQLQGMVKGRESRDVNSIYLWVMDRDGNIIFAPEVQKGFTFKHGDLTPGKLPWERPAEGVLPRKEDAGCCCKPIDEESSCDYTLNDITEVDGEQKKKKICCKWRVEGCSPTSGYSQKWESSFCRMPSPDHAEKYVAGGYRGIARAGGEMRFPDNELPLLQNKSGYSLSRLSIHGSDRNADAVRMSLDNARDAPPLTKCAMRALKEYWKELGLPMQLVTTAAAEYDTKGKEHLTRV